MLLRGTFLKVAAGPVDWSGVETLLTVLVVAELLVIGILFWSKRRQF